MQIIRILMISLILIGGSSQPLFSHTDHHKTDVKQEKKKHDEHHNQMHPKPVIKPVNVTSSNLQVPLTNTDNLRVELGELIFLLLIVTPFSLHLLKDKMYHHE